MATLETQQFTFEPDMKIIREQCDQVMQRDPSLKKKIAKAMRIFKDARACVNRGDVRKAFEKLSETLQYVIDKGIEELEASCFCYMGFLALAVGSSDPDMVKTGLNLLDDALRKTRNPFLTLNVNNRLMIHHLNNEDYNAVMNHANATEMVVSQLPRSNAVVYFRSAASYNRAEAHYRQGQYSEVIPHIQAALAGFRELSMKPESAKSQGLLGNTLIVIGEVKRGLEDTEKSIDFFRELKNEREIPFLLQGRGLAMLQIGNKAEAIRDLREALKLFKRFGEINALNSTLAILSNIEAQ